MSKSSCFFLRTGNWLGLGICYVWSTYLKVWKYEFGFPSPILKCWAWLCASVILMLRQKGSWVFLVSQSGHADCLGEKGYQWSYADLNTWTAIPISKARYDQMCKAALCYGGNQLFSDWTWGSVLRMDSKPRVVDLINKSY